MKWVSLWDSVPGVLCGVAPSRPSSSEMERLQGRGPACSPLVRVGLALLAHVVGGGLAEVQPPHSHLRDLLGGQADPAEEGQGTQGAGKGAAESQAAVGHWGQECVGGAHCGCLPAPPSAPAGVSPPGDHPPRARHSRDRVEGPLASVRLRLLDVDGLVEGLQLGEGQRPKAPQGPGSPPGSALLRPLGPGLAQLGLVRKPRPCPPLSPQTLVPSPTRHTSHSPTPTPLPHLCAHTLTLTGPHSRPHTPPSPERTPQTGLHSHPLTRHPTSPRPRPTPTSPQPLHQRWH